MNEFEFDRLIESYQRGLLTGKEKKLVEDWLSKPGSHEDTAFTAYDKLALKHRILSAIEPVEGQEVTLPVEIEASRPASTRFGLAFKIAASLMLVALSVYFLSQNAMTHEQNVTMLQAMSSGAIHKVILP